jgi:hypothetical protein
MVALMADGLDNQSSRPKEEQRHAADWIPPIEDTYKEMTRLEKRSSDAQTLDGLLPPNSDTTPNKPRIDGAKAEPAAVTPAKDTKTPPVDSVTPRREAQTPRDAAAPTISPGDKAGLPAATNRGTEKASEQPVKPADSVIPSVRQSDVQPALQRPSEAISTQPVARVPDRVPDNLPSSKAEQPSDRALLPGLAIVGPEGKAQQGNAGTVGTTDGKAHDPVVAKPQDLAAKSHDPATAKAQEALGAKVNDTGLRGSEPELEL